jgi:Bifunctional DNA primase/polymerase, N-terminal
METLALALDYIQKDFSIIPLKPRSKIPLLGSWEQYKRIYTSKEQIKEWFSNGHAENNIAIVTGKISRIIAFDLTVKKQEIISIEQLKGLMMKDLR